MYCFNFFRNYLWQHLINYIFRNVNICLLEVAICEKCRNSHFQLEGGVKSLRTGGVSTPLHTMSKTFGVHAHFLTTLGKQMNINYVPCLNKIDNILKNILEQIGGNSFRL